MSTLYLQILKNLLLYVSRTNYLSEIAMSDVKDYTSGSDKMDNVQYDGVSSSYSKRVENQFKMQPKYCEPGESGEGMRGEKRNVQKGP